MMVTMELAAQESATNAVKSHGEGLPPERKPAGRLLSVVGHEDWGKTTIYDLEPEPEPDLPPPPEKAKSRKSIYGTLPRLSEIIPTATEVTQRISQDNVSEESEEFWILSAFHSFMIATILEYTISALQILVECNTPLRILKTMADMPVLKAKKYGVQQVQRDELDDIDPDNLHCLEYSVNKLEADRNKLLNLFLKLYGELAINKTFLALIDFVNEDDDRKLYAINLREEEAKNRILAKELAKKLRIQRNYQKTVVYDAENMIARLRSDIEDADLMTETKGRYVDNWQFARTEQHKLVIFEKESESTDSTFYYKRRADHESRVHAEVESLTNIVINETLESIENWMTKYETDTEKLDLKIQIQRSEYQTMLDKRVAMEQLYAKRDKEIKAWLKFKDDREKERAYANRMTASAITVQAWWRGLLVRKQLGPFRKRKGKGKHK